MCALRHLRLVPSVFGLVILLLAAGVTSAVEPPVSGSFKRVPFWQEVEAKTYFMETNKQLISEKTLFLRDPGTQVEANMTRVDLYGSPHGYGWVEKGKQGRSAIQDAWVSEFRFKGQRSFLWHQASAKGAGSDSYRAYGVGWMTGLVPGPNKVQVTVWTGGGLQLEGEVTVVVGSKASEPQRAEYYAKGLEKSRANLAKLEHPQDRFNYLASLQGSIESYVKWAMDHGSTTPDDVIKLLSELPGLYESMATAPQPRYYTDPKVSWPDYRRERIRTALIVSCYSLQDIAHPQAYAIWTDLVKRLEADGTTKPADMKDQYRALANLAYGTTGDVQAARNHLEKMLACELEAQLGYARKSGKAFDELAIQKKVAIDRANWPEFLKLDSREPQPRPDPQPKEKIASVSVFDANPLFLGGKLVENVPTAGAKPVETAQSLLAVAKTPRKGAAADGVSKLLLVGEFTGPGRATFQPKSDADGTVIHVSALGNNKTVKIDENKHIVMAVYTPPAALGGTGQMPGNGRPERTIELDVLYYPESGSVVKGKESLTLAAPPVLLVHGTFDSPENCWERTADGEAQDGRVLGTASMADSLRSLGLQVFLVDYESSNGSSWNDKKCSFADNRRVLGENPGGIREAIKAYRQQEQLACTQVDVVGHSLGGLIPRLWASDHYNPAQANEPGKGYRRAENFDRGDIHRLITIATTHRGSDVSEFMVELKNHDKKNTVIPLFNAASRVAIFSDWFTGTSDTAAVKDQFPHYPEQPNEALLKIGATKVPAHAIVCSSRVLDLQDFGREYEKKLAWIWDVFYKHPDLLETLLKRRGLEDRRDDLLGQFSVIEFREGFLNDRGEFNPEVELTVKNTTLLLALTRAAMFGSTQNDCTVRVESQSGGLPRQYISEMDGVLHGYATRYETVQRRVAELLLGDGRHFCPDGFPAHPNKAMITARAVATRQDPHERALAIDLSNMVPQHAEAISIVAQERKETILFRPINAHATPLIAAHDATKDMPVKGKSADWGPQQGYIPYLQQFSKLHYLADPQKRKTEIEHYSEIVKNCVAQKLAGQKPLRISIADDRYDVRVVTSLRDTDPEAAIVLRKVGGEEFFGWQNDEISLADRNNTTTRRKVFSRGRDLIPLEAAPGETVPLEVLTDRNSGKFLTADYDLLAIAVKETEDYSRETPGKDPIRGYVTKWQIKLIDELNNSVRVRGNYLGGNVVHHGPETQFLGSEGADYPITAFEPSGLIRTIPSGPVGAKDRNLKLYFHSKQAARWQLTSNPNWRWKSDPRHGYVLEDPVPGPLALPSRRISDPRFLLPDNPFDSGEDVFVPAVERRQMAPLDIKD